MHCSTLLANKLRLASIRSLLSNHDSSAAKASSLPPAPGHRRLWASRPSQRLQLVETWKQALELVPRVSHPKVSEPSPNKLSNLCSKCQLMGRFSPRREPWSQQQCCPVHDNYKIMFTL